jgi:hypothetical protein
MRSNLWEALRPASATENVKEAELSTYRRVGAPECNILAVQANLACTYDELGQKESALNLRRDVYFGFLKLNGEENEMTLIGIDDSLFIAANNYASSLIDLERSEEAKSVLRKAMPVARRALGEDDITLLRMRMNYARALYLNTGAVLDDLGEAVEMLLQTARTARRVLGGAHPLTGNIGEYLREVHGILRGRKETQPAENLAEEVD